MAKHEKTDVDLNQPYEQNVIGLQGVIYFGVGLFLLIVITFGLMWVFQFQVLEPNRTSYNEENKNPMAMDEKERIPSQYQLQSAPGFGVNDPKTGERINLELREPQAEYRVLQKFWEEEWKNGQKDEKTGTVISLSIKEAKERFLADPNLKAKNDEEGEKAFYEASSIVSASSSGRTRTDIRR